MRNPEFEGIFLSAQDTEPTFRTSPGEFREFPRLVSPESARGHAERVKYLRLRRSEFHLEALHEGDGAAEQVTLGVAEYP